MKKIIEYLKCHKNSKLCSMQIKVLIDDVSYRCYEIYRNNTPLINEQLFTSFVQNLNISSKFANTALQQLEEELEGKLKKNLKEELDETNNFA